MLDNSTKEVIKTLCRKADSRKINRSEYLKAFAGIILVMADAGVFDNVDIDED